MRDDTGPKTTLSDIAKATGLSSATVSMALRGSDRIPPQTRKRVERAAVRLGYVYDRGAATLRTGESNTIGVIIGDISNAFFGDLVYGVDRVLCDAGKISFLLNTREDVGRQDVLLTRLREQGVDGIILCPTPGTDAALIARFAGWRLPLVQMLRAVPGSVGDMVSVDYQSGVEAICEHLVRLGHRRIAFVGGNLDHSATAQRLRGFETALTRHGLDARLVVRCPPDRRSGRHAVGKLLGQEAPPSAALCFNDIVAFGVIAGLRARGIEPGADFAVTGFDDVDEATESWPPLTTVTTHPRLIGEEAGRLLLRRIADPDGPAERVILPTRLVIRQSCGGSTHH